MWKAWRPSCISQAGSECESWLACDTGASVHPGNPVDAIAGKPAPTLGLGSVWRSADEMGLTVVEALHLGLATSIYRA
ncbi:hypothetical protein DXV65_11205 [Pseudomonas fluorescens]|nr:hypothetical protein DXV65_11205 [Pseudomonas fluorescens]